jgi:transmembrane sensor
MKRDRTGLSRERESSQTIEAAAADWAARADRGPLSAQDQARLDDWLAGDPRRFGAYARLMALNLHSERARALGADYDGRSLAAPAARPGSSRRGLLWGGVGAAAASVVGGVALTLGLRGEAYATERGEVRRIPLSNGSTVTLNTQSRLVVHDGEKPWAELQAGEALFEITGRADRPFRLDLGGVEVRARAAAFVVRAFASRALAVTVQAGRVRVAGGAARFAPVDVAAGTQASIDSRHSGVVTTPISRDGLLRGLAWREGKLAFEDNTLAYAAAEFARYGDPRIEIADPGLARETISGLFSVRDPAGFAQVVSSIFDARAQAAGDRILLSRPAPAGG